MRVLRQKIFFNKLPYKSTAERLGVSGKYGLIGAGTGAVIGGLLGGESCAIIGATGGGLLASRMGWVGTSKKTIDRENKQRENWERRQEEIKKNPRILFKSLDNDVQVIREYRIIESEYGIKFPEQLYKLIKLRKQFIPTLVSFYKEYGLSEFWDIILDIQPIISEGCLAEGEDNEVILLVDPLMADDTWISWNPKSGIFDGKYKTLKDAILNHVKRYIDFYEDEENKELLMLAKKYYQHISFKL